MLTIRLQRTGTKNKPAFRIVLAEKEKAAGKKFQEVLGHYNPRNKEFGIKNQERLNYWIAQKVEISPTVYNLLVEKKLVEGKKVKAWRPKLKAKEEQAQTPQAESKAAAPMTGSAETEVPKAEAPGQTAVGLEKQAEETRPAKTQSDEQPVAAN